ncbi:MAG: hypothetical protein JHC85_06505 [Chthoniobacterales bacterium]|nr:hypothetical protein [Chthoniobacterales bacterium]
MRAMFVGVGLSPGCTTRARKTLLAALNWGLPAWEALMKTLPAALNVTTLPLTVATAFLLLVYLTGSPELATAFS